MVRNRSRFVRSAGPKRTSTWIQARLGALILGGSSKILLLSLNAAALALRPFTVVRTLIHGNFRSDQAAVTEVPTGSMGATIVSDQASAVGVTAVPGSITDADEDWFAYQGMTSPFTFLSSVGIIEPAGFSFMIDSKAMRKVRENDDLIFVAEVLSAQGAILNLEGRLLLKLH